MPVIRWGIMGLVLLQGLSAGEISGRVKVSPVAPANPVMISPYSRNRYAPPRPVASVDAMSTIVIYLKAHPNLTPAGPASSRGLIDQRDLSIVPHLSIVQRGTTVDFSNSDDVFHNIFSLSRVQRFNLGRYPRGESRSVTFDTPGTVYLFCDIHSDMSGVVRVVPNRYFAVPAADGSFRIRGIPPGTYTIAAWGENQAERTQQVLLNSADDHVELSFEF